MPRSNLLQTITLATALSLLAAASLAPAAPKIASPAPDFQFGSQYRGSKVPLTFTITNKGDQVLEIGRVICVWGSSGAVSAKSLAPGASATITATLTLNRPPGPAKLDLIVESNDPDNKQFHLHAVGEVLSAVSIEPAAALFGDVDVHAGAAKVLTISAATQPLKFEVTRAETSRPDVFNTSIEAVEAGRVYKVHVTVSPDALPGDVQTSILLRSDNPAVGAFFIPIKAHLVGELLVTPLPVWVISARDNRVLPVKLTVASADGKPFKVISVQAPADGVTSEVTAAGPSAYTITLTNLAPAPGLDGKAIIVKTDFPQMGELRVPIRTGRASALATQPASQP